MGPWLPGPYVRALAGTPGVQTDDARPPIAFGALVKRGDPTTARWIRPLLEQPGIRSETVRMIRAVFVNTSLLNKTAKDLVLFERPAFGV